MGLRLYQAPVESDIQSKPAAEKTSAQARSSIRRGAQGRSAITEGRAGARDHRRRQLQARAVAEAARRTGIPYSGRWSSDLGRQSPPPDEPTRSSAPGDDHVPSAAEGNSRRMFRHVPGRLGTDEQTLAAVSERWARLFGRAGLSPPQNDDAEPPMSEMAVDPEFLSVESRARLARLPPLTESYAISNLRSTQEPGHPSRTLGRPFRRLPWSMRDSSRPTPRARERLSFESSLVFTEPPTYDGLGDRNRSLSPEGDHVWDTLLTTLTPDPQPPSVGSSFASTSASVVASQDAATGSSSRTSFTVQDAAEESAFEAPCESGCEGSETEGDEDDDENPLARFANLRSARRSYADVTRSSDSSTREHSLEILGLGGIDGMQRIVSNLARREDIPESWWAEAGLSRTLSREGSN
ncbi:hypothetical protein QBC47DRAFT_384104 [Echria macrotheca]|uniref:Uncharacterized protein n=1 Tax=Echria macrotheca TaxID=438768 RepID=A0AAJ0BA50_9PEZI|nr:hypothetical protein QBC47DRAFT_384104 [Echria macrotheca]